MSDTVPVRRRATAARLFEAQAERTPGAIALVHGDTSLTYAQLNAEANRQAHYLISLGLGPEDIAAIAMPRSAAAIVAILGVLKSGAAYLPLDLRNPSKHLARVLDHARPACVIASTASNTISDSVIALDVEETAAAIARQRTDNPSDDDRRRPLAVENAAYVIYTSGSTGQPKGVVVTHAGLAPLAAAQVARFGVTAESRVLQFASLSFDASVSELLMAFTTGATLVVVDDDARTGAALRQMVVAQRITHATFPPALLATLDPGDIPVPNVIVAGEVCPAGVAARWSIGRRLINAYGPTEATVCATMTAPLSGAGTPSIGTPIDGCRVYVLDGDLRPVPPGVVGEICIAGDGVARGYLHQPRLTAERFVPDPYAPAETDASGAPSPSGARMYRTGDTGRWHADGELEFAGRRDRQVKIGGIRIELDEVETAMREHPAVADAMVIARTPQRARPAPELWPSVAEYFVYDDLLYLAMVNDTRRNEAYRQGLARHVAGKVVLDAGTGAEALLARMSVEAGARRVYAVEYLEETYRKAAACLQRHGLSDRIILIRGDLRTVVLPEPIDVCVSELVGPIASMEGAAPLLNAARRLLAPDGVMLPERATTKVAAVSWPEDLSGEGFAELPAFYARQIFAQAGRRFDLRLCVRHFPHDHVLSTAGTFEEMDFSRTLPLTSRTAIDLAITRTGRVDGFLLWLNLLVVPGAQLDILEHDHCWLPVYVPCEPSLTVTDGDRIAGTCTVVPSANGVNPDYAFDGLLIRADGTRVPIHVETKHATGTTGGTALHRRLLDALAGETPGPRRSVTPHPSPLPFQGRGGASSPSPRLRGEGWGEGSQAAQASLVSARRPPGGTTPLRRRDGDAAGDGVRLTAYAVCGQTDAERREHDARHVEEWRRVYDDDAMSRDRAAAADTAAGDSAAGDADDDGDAETRGWSDSYTGEPIPSDEMREWAEETAGRIRSLRPRRVVEIGCGTGLLLTRVAADCGYYAGTDLSPAVLRRLARRIARAPKLAHVELKLGAASDLTFLDDASVDVMILNSVIQYFPSVEYLLDVLRAAMRVVRPHGHIYLGDVRSLPLLDAFHTSVQLSKAGGRVSARELRQRVAQARRSERELVLAPDLFEDLARRWPQPGRVEIFLKTGGYDNELSRFRYDVLMTLGAKQSVAAPRRWLTWDAGGRWRDDLERALAADDEISDRGSGQRSGGIGVRMVPDARVTAAIGGGPGEHPGAIVDVAHRLGVGYHWQDFRSCGAADVVFRPEWIAAATLMPVPDADYRRFATSPSWASFGRAQAAALRDHLRTALPAAMVPERVVILQAWPMTVNGKIDREALPAPEVETAGASQAPRSAEEEILHGLYAELLDRREIGIDEDFFALGGHSLMAARLAGRIRSALNVDVPIRTVFESPTIASLAARLWEARDGRVALTALERPARVPLSSVQHRLWSIDRRDGGSPQYNLLRAVRIDGDLDAAALERAVNEIVARHEVLRTSFRANDDDSNDPLQMIAPELRITIPLLDLSDLEPRDRQARVRRFLVADAGRSFDLTRAPMMRLTLLKVAAHSHVLVRTMHYIVKDGWSEGLFNRELSRLYRYRHRGEAPPLEPALEPLPIQYADFAVWQRRALETGAWSRGLEYWKRQLRDVARADTSPHAGAEAAGTAAAAHAGEIETMIGAEETDGLRRLNRETGTTLYMTLLAALGVVLTRCGHEREDVVIGSPAANRQDPRLEHVIGCFANPLPMRLRVTPALTLRELLMHVRQTTLEAYQHQDVPYEQLIEELWPERRTERTPGFQVLLAYQNAPWQPLQLNGLRVEPVKWPQLHARIDLEVNAWLTGDHPGERPSGPRVGLTWTFARDVFDQSRIETIAREFTLVLAAMASEADVDTPLALVPRLEACVV